LNNFSHLATLLVAPLKQLSCKPKQHWVSGFRQVTDHSSLSSVPLAAKASSSPAYFITQIRPHGYRA